MRETIANLKHYIPGYSFVSPQHADYWGRHPALRRVDQAINDLNTFFSNGEGGIVPPQEGNPAQLVTNRTLAADDKRKVMEQLNRVEESMKTAQGVIQPEDLKLRTPDERKKG